jgi:hypothetical protein
MKRVLAPSLLAALAAIGLAPLAAAQNTGETQNITLIAGKAGTFGSDYPFGPGYVAGLFTCPFAARGRYTQDTVNKTTPNGVFQILGGVIHIPKVSSIDRGAWTITYTESNGMGAQSITYNVTVVTAPTPSLKPTPTPTPKVKH